MIEAVMYIMSPVVFLKMVAKSQKQKQAKDWSSSNQGFMIMS